MKETKAMHFKTTEALPGYEVEEVKGFVWATSVRSKFIGKDIIAVLRIFVGGEIIEYTDMINDAKRKVIAKILRNAKALGANAVIGARFSTPSQVVPGAIEISCYGTAVKVKKKNKK